MSSKAEKQGKDACRLLRASMHAVHQSRHHPGTWAIVRTPEGDLCVVDAAFSDEVVVAMYRQGKEVMIAGGLDHVSVSIG